MHSDAGIRYDLFPGGESEARERLLMDFFGNVQNVEVMEAEGGGNGTEDGEWKEDLLALGRKIGELKAKAEMYESEVEEESRKGNSTPSNRAGPGVRGGKSTTRRVGAQKVMDDEQGWWGKKAVGAWALLGCGAVWAVGSYFESGV